VVKSPVGMKNLRQTLAAIALAAPLAGCFDTSNCPGPDERWTKELFLGADPAADPDLGPLLAACKEQQDCEPLCDKAYEREYGRIPRPDELQDCALANDDISIEERVTYTEQIVCVGGRRPGGYRSPRGHGTPLARYLCEQADLEAASVRAFSDLLQDLISLDAPISLRRAVVAAAGDELRHAQVCRRLARHHGGAPIPRRVATAARRSRYELAADNLVEGCIRETYGAVLAGYQARAAGDARIRRAMTAIARDEAKHAALAWRLHQWLWARLSAEERSTLTARAAAARAELRAPVRVEDAELSRVAGLPDAVARSHMLAELDRTVWATLRAGINRA
jgi:hypothetical protein